MVWWFNRASEIMPNWRDGLRAAIELIGKDNEVVWFLDEKVPDPKEKWDFILFWGDTNCPFFNQLDNYTCRKGLCLTTMPYNYHNLEKIDVTYCESTPVYEAVKSRGFRAIKAFGTDTNFYKPSQVDKYIEYFYPATFSPWKAQSFIAHYGDKLLCCGTVQPDGTYELEQCEKNGVKIKIGYFPPEVIRDYYDRAKKVPIPAIHGSERTCLEAMSMNILPDVNPNNKKTYSYIEEYRSSGFSTPREFVIKNYSAEIYAKNILKGMKA